MGSEEVQGREGFPGWWPGGYPPCPAEQKQHDPIKKQWAPPKHFIHLLVLISHCFVLWDLDAKYKKETTARY